MRKANYLKLKEQLGIIREIEELYVPEMSRGDNKKEKSISSCIIPGICLPLHPVN